MALTQGNVYGDVVIWLMNIDYNLDTVTVAQNGAATAGLPVGQIVETSSGKRIVCATGANADGVLLEPVSLADLLAGDTKRLAIVRGPAIINSSQVTIAGAQKAAALTALIALNIRNKAEPTFSTQTT